MIAATGLFAAGAQGGPGGPFAAISPRWLSEGAAEAHGALFGVLLALIVLHAASVFAEMLSTGENPVPAMLTGRKKLSAQEARREDQPVASLWALVIVAVSGAMVWFALA